MLGVGIAQATTAAAALTHTATVAGTTTAAHATAQADSTHTVTLITGDRVTVHDIGGRQIIAVVPRPGSTGGYVDQRLQGDVYVIPVAALPYLDTSLDRSLFDVSALVRDGITDTIPVRVTGTAPGISGGHVTAASALVFGAALAAQARQDARSHAIARGPLFGTASFVRLAAAGAPQRVTPHFPMHTVRLLTTGLNGAPADAELGVINIDDDRYDGFPEADGGEARISVPSGHYAAIAVFMPFDANGDPTDVRMVTTEFTVTGDRTVTVDERLATSRVGVTTPRQSVLVDTAVSYERDAAGGGSITDSLVGFPAPVYVAPSAVAAIGALHFNVQTHSESPANAKDPYVYDLKFDEAGAISHSQHFTATPDQLATLKENYYTDVPSRAESTGRVVFLPYEAFNLMLYRPIQAPVRRTEYVLAADRLYIDGVLGDAASHSGATDDVFRRYAAGSAVSHDWLHGPLAAGQGAPGIDLKPGQAPTFDCQACRYNDTIRLAVDSGIDSAGDQVAFDAANDASRLRLLSGGSTLLDVADENTGAVTVPAGRAGYQLIYDLTRGGDWFHQSSSSHTVWTFASARSGTRTVPDNWVCDYDAMANTDCSALPMLTAAYQLDTGLDGTAPAGPDQLQVTFAHAPGTPNLPIAKASVQVSFDGGATWTPTIQTSLGGGRYRARWTNPASPKGGDVALRVSATDVAGNTITQSVTAALTITGAQS